VGHILFIKKKTFALLDKQRIIDAGFLYRIQVQSLIEKFKIDVVIDVGANEGQFARNLRSFYAGQIHSFEPVSSVYEKLAVSASDDPNWHVHKLAIGSQDSTQTINVSDSTMFSSFFKTNEYCIEHFGGKTIGTMGEVVSVRRLDKLLDEIVPDIESRRVFLKMDTQGYDTEVFKGLGNKINLVSVLQSEVSLIPIYEGMPHWTDSISEYERAGFGVAGMFPVNLDSGRIIECDCLLIRVKS
jgi:FkbM family methyltransferase